MGIIKEFAALWRLRYRTPDRDRALMFYSEHESYFAYFEGMISALKDKLDTNFCYITSDPSDPILVANDPRIHAFYIDKLLPFFLKMVNCRVFVMTLTDLDQFHLKRSVNDVHYVYVFHAMNSIHMCYRLGAFDHYDSILCTGPYQVLELNKESELRQIRKRELVEAGYSRLERIHSAWRSRPDRELQQRTILLAPSWAANNVLEMHGVELVGSLLEAGYSVIVRPHPETTKRFPEILSQFEASFADSQHFLLERSVRTDDSLLRADVLITDWSGIALEYAFGTERPVLYIDVPRKVHNDQYEGLGIEPFEARMREQLGVVVRPDELSEIAGVVDRLVDDHSMYCDRIRRLRAENVFNFGRSSEVGAAHIGNLIQSEN